METIEISCIDVRRELSNYIDEDISAEFRMRIDEHLRSCPGCRAVFDGVQNILKIVGTGEVYRVPAEFGTRLYIRVTGAISGHYDVR